MKCQSVQTSGMILAAGWGTRLQPLSLVRAKPAVPLAGRPLVHYAMDLLYNLGIREAVINLHHLADTVREAAHTHPLPVSFSEEETPLGTAGAVDRVRPHLEGKRLILINGKIYFGGGLSDALQFHLSTGAWVTLVLVPRAEVSPFTPVWLDESFRLRGFGRSESPPTDNTTGRVRAGVFTGIQIWEPEVLSFLSRGARDLIQDVYIPMLKAGAPVFGFWSSAPWYEASTPVRYLRASLEVTQLLKAGLGFPSGVEQSDLEPGAKVGVGCRVRRCVLWKDAFLPDGSVAEQSVFSGGGPLPPAASWMQRIVTPRTPVLEELARRNDIPVESCYIAWPLEGIRPLTGSELSRRTDLQDRRKREERGGR